MRPIRHRDSTNRTTNDTRHQGRHQKIAPAAAILFRNCDTCIALSGETLPEPAGKIVGTFNFGIMRPDLVSRKSKSALIGKLMLFGKFKVHYWLVLSGVACIGRTELYYQR